MSEELPSEIVRHFGVTEEHPFAREELLGVTEVAQWLGVSRAWVYEHSNGRRRPYLPSVKLGKSVRFRPTDVEVFILECERFNPIRAA
ncbi:MAG TPA: helix-turn-helix domain-containing protein [Blastocatellia bacterium]|nr:helix-turn-helix domain-containing protein [Blastocatellia bacterium]